MNSYITGTDIDITGTDIQILNCNKTTLRLKYNR